MNTQTSSEPTLRTSDQVDKLVPALLKAQQSMGKAHKNATNPHFGRAYANFESVWDAVHEPLSENDLLVTAGSSPGDGSTVTVTTRIYHQSGQWIESSLTLRPAKNDPQGVGSAMTYGRRYTLAALVCLNQTDDDANDASLPPQGQQQPKPRRNGTPKPNGKVKANLDPETAKAMAQFSEAFHGWTGKPANSPEAKPIKDMIRTFCGVGDSFPSVQQVRKMTMQINEWANDGTTYESVEVIEGAAA